MSVKFNESTRDDNAPEFVNIHGHDIPAVVYGKSGKVAFPLSELQQTGVGIYRKSQYAKLATVDKKFDDDFHLFMLESAKSYMLMNKISFSEDQILQSVNNCKKVLSNDKRDTVPNGFLGGRLIEGKSNDEILIQVSNTPSASRSPQTTSIKHKSAVNYVPQSPKDLQKFEISREVNEKTPKNTNQVDNAFTRKPYTPRNKVLDRISLNQQKKGEHDVVVTCIDKRNCIWARDKANEELFNTVYELVNEEEKFQRAPPKPFKFEKVYMAPDEGSWFRCKIVRFNPLTVFFLDYGNVAVVDQLKTVSDELAKIPCMAVRVTFKESDYVPELQDEIRIKILMQNEDGTYFVNVLKTNQNGKSPVMYLTQETKKSTASCKFSRRPPPICSLQKGQKVVIVHEEDGVLYLRTRECLQKLQEIENELENLAGRAEHVQNVEVNQLVMVSGEDGKFYRGVVTKLMKNRVMVEYLDYVKKSLVNAGSMRNINESLSLHPTTYFRGGKLNGVNELNEACRNKINKIIQERSKYTVVGEGEDFDLSDGTHLLSQQLVQKADASDRVFLRNMKRYEPEMGVKSYLLGSFKDGDNMALVSSDMLEQHIDSVLMMEMEDSTPYTPVVEEVCYTYYMDQWYRCVVTRIINNEFEVLLLDFGNVEYVKKDELRKPGPEILEIPTLALPCRLVDLPDLSNVHDLLKKIIIEGELYKVDLKSISEGKYNVEIPSLYQQIRKSAQESW